MVPIEVEFTMMAPSESVALMDAWPLLKELEKILDEEGYAYVTGQARPRRPRASEKAKAREERKRRENGQGA